MREDGRGRPARAHGPIVPCACAFTSRTIAQLSPIHLGHNMLLFLLFFVISKVGGLPARESAQGATHIKGVALTFAEVARSGRNYSDE